MKNLIVFLSDFGLIDPYAAIVKGVIYSINPSARVIDLSHEVSPQDINQGAFILYFSLGEFPEGTIFLCVVDPGVGSNRAGLIVKSGNKLLVGPDNGLFGPVIQRENTTCLKISPEIVTEKAKEKGWKTKSSRTFHGRDIFAPTAALLSLGSRPEDLGSIHPSPITFSFPEPELKNGTIRGEIVYFDHFGNAVTNIPSAMLEGLNDCRNQLLFLENRNVSVPFRATYSLAKEHEAFFLVNSFNLVEIAVNCGNARNSLGLKIGDRLLIRCN